MAIPIKKGGENFEGEHSLGLETLVHTGGLALFILTFMTVGLMFLLLLFKALVHCSQFQSYIQYLCLCHYFVAFF